MQLFINTYGTSLRINEGLLSIKKNDKIQRVPVGKISKIFVSKSVFLTSDVVYSCIENGIDLIFTERSGKPVGRLWNNRFGSISSLRKKQLQFSKSRHVTPWVIKQIGKKTSHQIEVLHCFGDINNTKSVKDSINRMEDIMDNMYKFKNISVKEASPKIRAIEGQLAYIYFRCVNQYLPFAFQFQKRTKRPALDMTNSMLNYAYGILYSHIESSLIKAGLDPYIGFFHSDAYNRPVLTYDVIEVFRPWTDWVVFHLCLNEVLDKSMFQVENGAYWLHGESKRILIQHFTDFFDELVVFEDKRFSRFTHIDRLASKLAKKIEQAKYD